MLTKTNLLIIGAGPFGLAISGYLKHLGIEHLLVGKPMQFWKQHMPEGMLLRSSCNWHFDPVGIHTIEAFLKQRGQVCKDVEPLSLSFYLEYAAWFMEQKGLEALPEHICKLSKNANGFEATTIAGDTIHAKNVVLATGLSYFKQVPAALAELLPENSFQHTCDAVDMAAYKGKKLFIIGGRQSAFEWAALLQEAGAAEVHLCYRHPTPAFATAAWTWVTDLFNNNITLPGWYRNLPQYEKEAITKRLWSEGRLKLEPWLAERINKPNVQLWPQTQLKACKRLDNGSIEVLLDNNQLVAADSFILATGYKPDVGAIPYLAAGNLLPMLQTENGFPVLDENFRGSVPGLYFAGMPASYSFGPFFGFTLAVEASAKMIGDGLFRMAKAD